MKTFAAAAAAVLVLAPCTSGVVFRSSLRNTMESLLDESRRLDKALALTAAGLEPGATKDFLTTLRLCAPCNKYERFGEHHDGGYVMCTDGLDKGLVAAYSYGINGFDGWGMAVADRYKLPLNEYDCTNLKQPERCANCTVNFHGECILAAKEAPQTNYKTLAQQLAESGNGKAGDRSLLLKIDVEAAEWQVFAQEPVENMKKFREIVVEYHWLEQVYNHELYLKAVKTIEAAGFVPTHLHGNNYGGGMRSFGEYQIPNVLEVTYIQKPAGGCAANVPYRLPIDEPNDANGLELPDAKLPTQFL